MCLFEYEHFLLLKQFVFLFFVFLFVFNHAKKHDNLKIVLFVRQIFGDTDSDSEPEGGITKRYHTLFPCSAPPIPPPTPDVSCNETCQTSARPLLDSRQTEYSSFPGKWYIPVMLLNHSVSYVCVNTVILMLQLNG